jgi:hypothetical protein
MTNYPVELLYYRIFRCCCYRYVANISAADAVHLPAALEMLKELSDYSSVVIEPKNTTRDAHISDSRIVYTHPSGRQNFLSVNGAVVPDTLDGLINFTRRFAQWQPKDLLLVIAKEQADREQEAIDLLMNNSTGLGIIIVESPAVQNAKPELENRL